MTNRELYLIVRNFEAKYPKAARPSLERYLSALWTVAVAHRDREPSIGELVEWLDGAFTSFAPDFDPEWLNNKYDASKKGFDGFESLILAQIVDLRQMDETGQLRDEQRYFGLDAPRGSRWYNFDTIGYLECAVRGVYGGYAEDETIVLDGSGDSEIVEITEFSWEDFTELLACGQFYE
ncbi:MAG: hypothetical protein JSS81_14615 [Acidobacteria bacterium]|nr:hypothetical protein [Acidobacteriota bacterium]